MEFKYEKIWKNITKVDVSNTKEILKKYIRYRHDSGICYFIAELDFITDDVIDNNNIVVLLPEIDDNFTPCENTIFATKTINGEEIDTIVRLKLFPGKMNITAYPFAPNSKYELNIQLFMCLNDEKFFHTPK